MYSNLKNIFLIGPSRAGKTTFAEMLQKLGYNHIVMDSVIETMMECFPESGIQHGNLESEEFKRFLKSFCQNTFKYGLPYVIDLEVLSPSFAKELINEDESTVVYIGYPSLTPEEKLEQIREHDTKFDWTRNVNDQELLRTLEGNIESSKLLKQGAKENNFEFLDVSNDRDRVFHDFIEEKTNRNNGFFYRSDKSYDRYER